MTRVNPIALVTYALLIAAAALVSPWFLAVAGILFVLSNVV